MYQKPESCLPQAGSPGNGRLAWIKTRHRAGRLARASGRALCLQEHQPHAALHQCSHAWGCFIERRFHGYAIHGSYEIKYLGRPASHGCIRLHPANAAILFTLVGKNMNSTQIVVTGGQ
ncbi:MAG TPA: L,D-transpeptidase [Pseudolabrys sp.]|nr:L,D-transpeptidase [Pseudolabrys sp.]